MKKSISVLALIASFSAFSDTFDDMRLQNDIQSQVQQQLEIRSKQDYYNNSFHEDMGTPYVPSNDKDYWSGE